MAETRRLVLKVRRTVEIRDRRGRPPAFPAGTTLFPEPCAGEMWPGGQLDEWAHRLAFFKRLRALGEAAEPNPEKLFRRRRNGMLELRNITPGMRGLWREHRRQVAMLLAKRLAARAGGPAAGRMETSHV